jgi:hypothetical protein
MRENENEHSFAPSAFFRALLLSFHCGFPGLSPLPLIYQQFPLIAQHQQTSIYEFLWNGQEK